ncbi:MAG TPA: redoxin domain-containing protein [Gemmatimonadales bacterium]|nr:redoxin domain-containing protein [Gemmatimonadales bacterium]
MSLDELRPPLKPGERAPDFTLPRVDRDGTVSLADYRGRSPLLLGLFRGVSCVFCRRAIAQLYPTADRLRALGVETLGIVATAPGDARLYFRYRPARLALAADPDLTTHRAYGLPRIELPWGAVQSTRINPTGELPEPLPVWDAVKALTRLDGDRPPETDREEMQRNWSQSAGEFLLDRGGIVRWAYVEYATGDLAGIGKFPTGEEILAAARMLST